MSKTLQFRHRLHLVLGFVLRFLSYLCHFLLVESCHCTNEFIHVSFGARHACDLAFLRFQKRENLAKVDAGKDLKFSGLGLQLVEPLTLGVLVLKKLLLLSTFLLDIVLQSLDDFLLSSDLLLSSFDFLFENLFSLFTLSQLLPESGVRCELLLQVVDLVLVALSCKHLLELTHDSIFSYDILESEHFSPGLLFVLLEFLQLFK